ncbi:hypothetical protein OG689_31750 [Kitasatospora sp. NBC_00240]|uniref:hypothetical protein n=1 Tax=Kitasatospora sp. NBC_00240 TaxID=2903567 RepID=UPI0022589499|nr:hypothetical protein [Kitasatospora sp. NBC_00240]MCX5213791.1 hypothetical protein [Kitasatospora sp. NBC_00240]
MSPRPPMDRTRLGRTLIGLALIDRALARAAARAGEPGGIRFTERQLYYELCRVLRPLHAGPRRIPYTLAPPVTYSRFREALARTGGLPGLLPAPAPAAPVRTTESDLYDYGFPRLLVCQDRAVARMLIANDLHLEAACPVFAAEELPLDPRLLAALDRAGDAVIHVLHDASPAGLACYRRIRDAHATPTRSMGLVPRHAGTLHLTAGRAPKPFRVPLPEHLTAGLRPAERAWLASGRFTEVAAVNPARLLHAVIRTVRGTTGTRTPVRHHLRGLREAGFMTWPTP